MTEKALRILVLEDRPADAELQLRELRDHGLSHCARRVETEEEFVAGLESWSPDLILADYSLPDFDGLSALSLAREKSPEIPFIFVTGTMGEENAIESLKNGTTDYVLKQRLERLVPAVKRALREAADLQKRRAVEEALRAETMERLRTMEELNEKNQLLIQQSRQAAMGEMLGHIAHQWRQPLNALGLTVQKLELYYSGGELNSELVAETVKTSMELIHYMSQTIDDFRNFYRPEAEKTAFKVGEAITRTLQLVRETFRDQRIEVELERHGDPELFGYPNELGQVLLNILNNARDVFSERRTANPKVTVSVSGEGGRAVLTLADNGGGVPAEILDRIFDPYFSTKGPQQGTGVGLFMAKTIIEKNMGGRLSVRNLEGGAEFRIEL